MLETRTDLVVRGALNGMAVRHRAVVDAIANVETPGFVPKTVAFEEQLRSMRDAMLADPLHTAVSPQSLPTPPSRRRRAVPGAPMATPSRLMNKSLA